MTVSEIRRKYLDFFRAKGHVVVPSAPLIPENDPTTLFTSSGMQPMVPYLLGETHPQGTRLTDSQKCFRAGDIEEVGDNRHTTFFEMLGNWSLGDYFKQEQIPWMYEFLTEEVGLPVKDIWVTCFDGDKEFGFPRDTEAAEIWKSLGIPDERIFFYGVEKNWWSRSGVPSAMPTGEPGGPSSEMFFDYGTPHDPAFGETCHPNCDCGRFVEIGNNVFMQYVKKGDAFEPLPKTNVDFGGGLERIAAASNNNPDVFLIDTMLPIIRELAAVSGKNYDEEKYKKPFRVVTDHLRAATFMISDGVMPGNTEQGYILRRLIRRAVLNLDQLGVGEGLSGKIATYVIDAYKDHYGELEPLKSKITGAIVEEESRFRKTLAQGMKELSKIPADQTFTGEQAALFVQTYGMPIEVLTELREVDMAAYEVEKAKHQDLSRSGSEQKFKGGLADTSEKTTMLHTSTHLMLAALRKYLGEHVHQAGSNITAERTRFDFTHPDKVPRDVLDKVEAYVNEAISKKAEVTIVPMPKEEAKAKGVEGSFWEKYPDVVNVYMVKADDGTIYSQELCGGPHVTNTGTIQGRFKIVKEEASSVGVRRIKAVLE